MALPILTFDERVLSPRFGYVFHRRWLQPYESIVGLLWKFARLNRLAGHTVVMHLAAVLLIRMKASRRQTSMCRWWRKCWASPTDACA